MEKNNRTPTGIKDIHDIEICVGDIVKVTYGDAVKYFSENEKVIMRDGKFYLDHEDGTSTLDSSCYSVEIIGNIHDKPEIFKTGQRISFWGD